MAYAIRADIEAKFGLTNVTKWASLDPADDAAAITARIVAALARAEASLDDRLRGGRYKVPFAAPIPSEITDLTATLAALWLHDSRGVENMDANGAPADRLTLHRKNVESQVRKLRDGSLQLVTTAAIHEAKPLAGV